MSILAKISEAPQPRTKDVMKISLFYAGILLILALAQLFTFDAFLLLIAEFGLPGGEGTAYLVASLLVVSEVFALPFLIRMPLSPLFRWVSMMLGWLAASLWLLLSLWVVVTSAEVESIGFLGTLVDILPGWWAVFISAGLAILAAWASWGLWPGRRKK